jgi:hypothetical protein
MAVKPFLVAACLLVAAGMLWLMIDGLRTGCIDWPKWESLERETIKFERQKRPMHYWSAIGLCFTCALGLCVMAVTVLFVANFSK